MPASKRCSKCDRDLPLSAFHVDKEKPDGHRAECKGCRKVKRVECVSPGKYTSGCPCAYCKRCDREREPAPGQPSGEACGCVQATEPKPPREVHVEETITVVDEHRLKREHKRLVAQVADLVEQLSDARSFNDLAAEVAASPKVEPITPRERKGKMRDGTALVLASDWHIEEEVRPETIDGRNRYNVEIARQRMTRFFESVLWAVAFNRQAFKVRDLVLWLGGDLITNYLHPDNIETNLLSPVQAIALAQQAIGDGIRFLLTDPELERIVIPCNDGNHGRLTEKMRIGSRVENSIEWLLYTSLAREFINERRVQFQIAEGAEQYLTIYDRTVRFTHGDNIRYGGGVGGITIPIMKALARWDTLRRADLTCMGHFHQLLSLPDLIINGSLIGYNAYAQSFGARFEPPAQAFTMLDPLRFKGISIPLWVANSDDDAHGRNHRK